MSMWSVSRHQSRSARRCAARHLSVLGRGSVSQGFGAKRKRTGETPIVFSSSSSAPPPSSLSSLETGTVTETTTMTPTLLRKGGLEWPSTDGSLLLDGSDSFNKKLVATTAEFLLRTRGEVLRDRTKPPTSWHEYFEDSVESNDNIPVPVMVDGGEEPPRVSHAEYCQRLSAVLTYPLTMGTFLRFVDCNEGVAADRSDVGERRLGIAVVGARIEASMPAVTWGQALHYLRLIRPDLRTLGGLDIHCVGPMMPARRTRPHTHTHPTYPQVTVTYHRGMFHHQTELVPDDVEGCHHLEWKYLPDKASRLSRKIDALCIFHPGSTVQQYASHWNATTALALSSGLPTLVTSLHPCDQEEDLKTIRSIGDRMEVLIPPSDNPFASLGFGVDTELSVQSQVERWKKHAGRMLRVSSLEEEEGLVIYRPNWRQVAFRGAS